jgi:RNA polymerase sigma-70 factor (ECF subfamily)
VSTSEVREPAQDAAGLFAAHRKALWGIGYRLTGSAEDADDVVQEAFARLIERPPERESEALGPWLVRVATNLGIDALRRRRRRAYAGPWLPAPVEGPEETWLEALASDEPDPERRYGLLESASIAFLLALEALGPRQRAVLLLRDVLGYSAREAGAALGATEESVRATHLRARRAMQAYDERRCLPTPELRERHRAVLARLLEALLAQDAHALEALLAESVRTVTDAAGQYTALPAALVGRARVARFYLQAARQRQAGGPRIEIRLVNGLPAALIELAHPVRRQAPRSVLRCELDEDGRIREIQAVLAPRKLGALRFAPPPPA